MKKILLALSVAMCTFVGIGAKDLSGVKIYINPGHGGYHNGGADSVFNADGSLLLVKGNDRNVPTINYEPLDTNGFWESKCNLIKGLELKRLLENAGATVKISRVLNREIDDKNLKEIAEEANEFGADAFISIHSNSAGMRARVNYFLNLYNYDFSGLGKNVTNMALSRHQATMSISYLMDNDITVWSPRLVVTEDKPFLGYTLGVLRHLNVPGFLVEGSFHDYMPETHRLLNEDYAKLYAWNLYRFYCDYFGADMPDYGVVSGAVKDNARIIDHVRFNNWIKGSHDKFLPLNGADVTLIDANGNTVATYKTDNNYNGVFVFWNVTPGAYTVKMEAEGYEPIEKTIEVKAGEMCDFVEFLTDSSFQEPILAAGEFNKWAYNLKTIDLGNGKYRLECKVPNDIDNAIICFTKDGVVVKDIKLGELKKGTFSKDVNMNDVSEKSLFWEINEIRQQ